VRVRVRRDGPIGEVARPSHRGRRLCTAACAKPVAVAVAAMTRTGVRRLVVVSASGLPGEGDDLPTRWLVRPILQRVFPHPYAAMARMEEIVRASGLDRTIVRPPRLVDGARTDRYRRVLDRHVRGGHRVARGRRGRRAPAGGRRTGRR
jgi:pimeloyl-ACP methyl ester carboxylesterase